jgi:hypothetical protein
VPSATLKSRRDAGLPRTLSLVRDGDHLPNPAEFAKAAGLAASARAARIVSAHTVSQIVSIVIVLAADQPVALAVVLGSQPPAGAPAVADHQIGVDSWSSGRSMAHCPDHDPDWPLRHFHTG